MFPAYGGGGGGRGGGGGGRRHNNNNYNHNNNGNYNNNRYYREPRLPPGGYGRSQPPPRLDVGDRRNGNNDVLLPEPVYGQFVANEDQFRLANEARQRETERQARQRQIEEQIIAQQEQSVYGLKQITPDEFDEDEDDIIPMAAPQERIVIVERRVIVKKKKSKKSKKNKKNKKKKHRKHRSRSSSSSSSSSGSESESAKANGSSSRKRRHGPDEGGEESAGEGTSAQAAKRQRQAPPAQEKEIISELDATLNPWAMLRKNEYNQFKSAYIVIERRPDYANLQYERAYKFELADYRSVLKPNAQLRDLHAISQQWTKLIWKPDQTLLTKEERWTADRHIQAMNELAERVFRRGVNPNFVDYVTLSHQPCAEDEEGQASSVPKREQLEQHHLNNMDFNDYAHYLESQKKSYEEAKVNDLEGRFSILHNKKTTNRHDVDAWLEFVDIQRLKFAKDESGDPEAPIQNERAYYERVMEIVGQAIRANQTSPELHIKQLLLMEQRGDSKQQLKHEWDRCLNRFPNNCKIWEENLKMQMNDRSKFGLEEMLHQIDFCIGKLVGIKSGTIRSHKLILGTEEFLVDLLVMRCRLLIATGYIDRAVSMLQALAEFHFFHPEELDTPEMKMEQNTVQRSDRALRLFQEFWRSGVHRIGMGTDHAEGWCNFEGEEEEDGGQQQQVDIAMQEEEEAHLGGIRERFEKALKKEVEEYKRKGLSLVEARRRLDAFKARYHWYPVRFQAHHADLYEYESRYVTYKQVRPVLFFFVDEKLAQELMFKLLHQFGVSVKGLNLTTSQEDILRSFSPSMFPSHRPSAMGLDHFEQFFTQFVRMLASSPHMDGVRMYTALVSIISNSTATKDKKWEEMYEMVRSKLPTMPQYRSGEVVSNAVQMALCTCLFDEMLKLKPAREANFPLNTCLRMLFLNFDQKPHSSLWELQQKVHRSEEARLEYLFMLRFVVLICRHLPYSDERRDTGVKVEIKANKREAASACCLETKRDFLLSIWATGKVGKVDMTDANLLEAAKKRARNVLRNPPPHDLEDLRMRWLGCPHELLFELAALYFYEFPWTPEQRYKFFSVGDTLFYRSQLGTALQDRPALQEMRVRVLQHITHSTTEYSPGQLVHLLEEQVDRFPHSVELLKTLLDVSRRHRRQIFLSKSPGQDQRTRLLRDCGRLYAERVRLNQDFKRLQVGAGGSGNEKEFKSLLSRFIEIFKRTAQAYSDNFIPDDYIWCRLLQQLVTCPDHIPSQALDEVFLLGHKVVPWSKAFLFEAARDRPGAQSSFMSTLESALAQAGLHSFCTEDEVKLYLTHSLG